MVYNRGLLRMVHSSMLTGGVHRANAETAIRSPTAALHMDTQVKAPENFISITAPWRLHV